MANQHTKKNALPVVSSGPRFEKRPPVKRKAAAVARGAAKTRRVQAVKEGADRSPFGQLSPNLKFVQLDTRTGELARLMRDLARAGDAKQDCSGPAIHVSDEAFAAGKQAAPLAEIPAMVEQLQAALNSLSNTLGTLTDRLEPVLTPSDLKVGGVSDGGGSRSTTIGMQLQSCFGQVEHIAYRTHDLLHRLAL